MRCDEESGESREAELATLALASSWNSSAMQHQRATEGRSKGDESAA